MKRNKHSLSHYRLLTCDMGRLIPVGCFEVLPGDTVQQATSALLRVSPMIVPVMHPISVRIHHWFVPHRLVWDGWEDFITGGPDGLGGDAGDFPTVNTGTQGFSEGALGDYLGIPALTPLVEVSALPLRSFNLIFNEFYRDQDLRAEIDLDTGLDALPPAICWEKDYFTSARPWPQKGPDVTMPLGEYAPVLAQSPAVAPTFIAGSSAAEALRAGNPNVTHIGGQAGDALKWGDPNLFADLSNASSVNVNDVRKAFAIQRYQEARARYGSRYTEYLRYLGVRSSDARLQRPEYLGGGKQTISFSEVLQTGPGGTDGSPTPGGVGQFAGHGISAMRSRRYRRFFEEHGLVLSLLSIRPRTMYTQHLPKLWSRRAKEDYWQKELEQIGQQEIMRREVFAQEDSAGTGGDTVFGYQDRYAEYKHIQSTVHGEMANTQNYWHLARSFASPPALNAGFVESNPTKRIFQEQTYHSIWAMVSNNIQARRMVSRSASSRIL